MAYTTTRPTLPSLPGHSRSLSFSSSPDMASIDTVLDNATATSGSVTGDYSSNFDPQFRIKKSKTDSATSAKGSKEQYDKSVEVEKKGTRAHNMRKMDEAAVYRRWAWSTGPDEWGPFDEFETHSNHSNDEEDLSRPSSASMARTRSGRRLSAVESLQEVLSAHDQPQSPFTPE